MKNIVIEHYGKDGFVSYRIPGIVVTAKDTIILYYEMRLETRNDWSTKGIGMKRSIDGGKTFEQRQTIAYSENLPVNNPVMIASKNGKIHFLWQKNYREAYYQVSEDDGVTFSQPINITNVIQKFREQYDWSLYAFGPGHGIELKNGRLVVPIWLAKGEGNNHFPTKVSTIISDDNGKTWEVGEIIEGAENTSDKFVWPNETQAVELSDGSVLLNIRHNGTNHFRYTTISQSGKDNFSKPIPDYNLPDSICFGSIVRTNYKNDILFVNCANREGAQENGYAPRKNLTVRLSEDDTKTWKYSKQIAHIGGYADIATSINGENFYCFFEQDIIPNDFDPKQLTLCIFNKQWLKK